MIIVVKSSADTLHIFYRYDRGQSINIIIKRIKNEKGHIIYRERGIMTHS